MKLHLKYLMLVFFICAFAVSCPVSSDLHKTQTVTSIKEVEVETPEHTPIPSTKVTLPQKTFTISIIPFSTQSTNVPSPTMIFTKTSPSSFLPGGEYLLYEEGNTLGLVSRDGSTKINLIRTEDMGSLLADKQSVFFLPLEKSPYIINLKTGEKHELPFLRYCTYDIEQINSDTFIGACSFNEQSIEIYLITEYGKNIQPLTSCYKDKGSCSMPSISPDGKWISYYWNANGAIQSSKVGLYITKASCLNTPVTCEVQTHGPFAIAADYVWSPDSVYIASSGEESIRIFKFNDGSIVDQFDLENTPSRFLPQFIQWSLDGDLISYTTNREVFLIAKGGGEPISVIKSTNASFLLLGWLRVPENIPSNVLIIK